MCIFLTFFVCKQNEQAFISMGNQNGQFCKEYVIYIETIPLNTEA